MPQILHTVLEPARALAATTESIRYDLPVNPLSAIIVTLRALNNTPTLANYAGIASTIMTKINNIRCRYRGATIFDGDPLDLVMVYGRFSGWWPNQGQINNDDNAVRSVTFALLFGRQAYDVAECFPATRRGDLVLEIDTAIDPTGLDGYTAQIETIELLDATPSRFIKVTTTQFTLLSGDVNDISLPIGNRIIGLLLRGNTFPDAASNNASFGQCALEIDNVEAVYSRTLWRGLHAMWARRTRLDWLTLGHDHTIDGSGAAPAAYAQATTIAISADANAASLTTGTAARSGITGITPMGEIAALQRYGFADFDPRGDLSFSIDTRGAADINWHVNSDVADGAASRVIPIEYMEVSGATPAGT